MPLVREGLLDLMVPQLIRVEKGNVTPIFITEWLLLA